ncbi:hypothetical protein [Streptomyces sp. BR1]|uniref:hypothetical protein n=1 Tax=Streptomyces sp. BR1 TaxID=1592323 RepID=UPI00402BEC20
MTGSPAATRTLGAVLGLGVLLLPEALGRVPPVTGLVLAVVLAGWCVLVARAGGTSAGGPVAFVRTRLGAGPARAMNALYFAGIATGQAAVALGAGRFVGREPYVVAVAVLAVGAVWTPPGVVGRVRLWLVLGVAGVWCLSGGPANSSSATAGWSAAVVAVPLLFGWVGLEGVVGTRLGGALGAVAVAAVLYAVVLHPPGRLLPVPPGLGAMSAVLCLLYCCTNLRATGARWAELSGRRASRVPGAVVALGALATGLPLPVLLLGPGLATAAIFLLVAFSTLVRSSRS